MIKRKKLDDVATYAEVFPVVAILGPRQCGKTTLLRQYLDCLSDTQQSIYLDLERASDRAKLDHPEEFFDYYRNAVVCLDEIQRVPELFETLRSVCDESQACGRFIVSGSASPDLLKQSSETLAGRIGYISLTPFFLAEEEIDDWRRLWIRGGFPRSYLAKNEAASQIWRESFITTFLERDLPQLGIRVPGATMRRFWEICAHLHGDLWNASKVATAMGVSPKTINHYLDILESAFVMRQLRPYAANTKKRLVKSPKVYIRDSGLLHGLLRVDSYDELLGHPEWGSSWEGFCIEQIMSVASGWTPSFYRTAAGAELDLVLQQGTKKIAFEFKAGKSPSVTKGFWLALEDVQPDRAFVVAQVDASFPIKGNIFAVSLSNVMEMWHGQPSVIS